LVATEDVICPGDWLETGEEASNIVVMKGRLCTVIEVCGESTYRDFPLAGCPFRRNVLGNSPSPQILNDPKSLYHGPSGASGSDFAPQLELVEILSRYLAIEEVLPETRW